MIRLHDRVKEHLTSQDTEATRQTLDEWLSAINIVQDRRRQEIENAAEKCRSGEPRLPDEKGLNNDEPNIHRRKFIFCS